MRRIMVGFFVAVMGLSLVVGQVAARMCVGEWDCTIPATKGYCDNHGTDQCTPDGDEDIVGGCQGTFLNNCTWCGAEDDPCCAGQCDTGLVCNSSSVCEDINDECSDNQTKCEGSYEYSCNTVANPNEWRRDTFCNYGCNTTNTACATAPSLPYCLTEPPGCGKDCLGLTCPPKTDPGYKLGKSWKRAILWER